MDGSHPSVQAHVHRVTTRDVDAHKEKREGAQTREMGKVGSNTMIEGDTPTGTWTCQCNFLPAHR